MRKDLLAWQWKLYPDNHTRHLTLVVHLVCAPLFIVGWLLVGASPVFGWELAVVGLSFVVAAVAGEGWTHKMEPARPVPFDGPMDFVARFVVEQVVTFPRFVFSGELGRMWRRG
jgi:hypothetical protein